MPRLRVSASPGRTNLGSHPFGDGARTSSGTEPELVLSVRALTFDVFGTVVDWRTSIIREGELLAAAKGLKVDWPAFADAWRAGYRPSMDRVARGELPWQSIDQLHRTILDGLLEKFGIKGLAEQDIAH